MEKINGVKKALATQEISLRWPAEELKKSTTTVTPIYNNKSRSHTVDLKMVSEVVDVAIRELFNKRLNLTVK